jgi:pilus assembly protein FimV
VAENDAAAARDTVKLSRVDAAAKGGGKGAGSERLRALEEEAVAREKSLADANERIAQLEKTIKDMQRLAEMKGAGKAAQAQAGGDKAGAAPRGAPAGEGPTGGVVAVAAVIPPPPPAAAKAPEPGPASPPTAGKAVPLEMAQAPAPQSEPGAPAAKAKPAAPAPAPAAEPDFIDTIMNEPLYLAAAGGAVVVLGGLALVAARRRRGNGNDRLVKISPTLSSEPDSAWSGAAAPASPAASAAPTPTPAAPKASVLEPERPAPKPASAPAVAATPAAAAPTAAPQSEDNDLDFNAGIRRAAASRAAPAADTMSAAQAAPRAPAPGVTPADQTKTLPTKPQPLVTPAAAKPQATAPAAAPDPSFASLHKAADSRPEPSLADFALNIPDAGPAEPNAPRETPASDLNMDFNLEPLPPIDATADSKTRAAPAADATDLDFKLDDLSLNFGPDAAPVTSGKDDHWYDVQQKFDLAKAYEEMGDKDGAREILQEVVKEGDSEQQTQAKKLLGSLG